jgi:hypothetical protein
MALQTRRANKLDRESLSLKRSHFRATLAELDRRNLEEFLKIAVENVEKLRTEVIGESVSADAMNLAAARERLFDICRAYYLRERSVNR